MLNSVSLQVFWSISALRPLPQVLGAERYQSHLVDHTNPYSPNNLGTTGPISSRLVSRISHSGKPRWRGTGSVSLSPLPPPTPPTPHPPQINFLIFVRILGILVSKLRTRQMRCPDYRLRWGRRGG